MSPWLAKSKKLNTDLCQLRNDSAGPACDSLSFSLCPSPTLTHACVFSLKINFKKANNTDLCSSKKTLKITCSVSLWSHLLTKGTRCVPIVKSVCSAPQHRWQRPTRSQTGILWEWKAGAAVCHCQEQKEYKLNPRTSSSSFYSDFIINMSFQNKQNCIQDYLQTCSKGRKEEKWNQEPLRKRDK